MVRANDEDKAHFSIQQESGVRNFETMTTVKIDRSVDIFLQHLQFFNISRRITPSPISRVLFFGWGSVGGLLILKISFH